MRRRVQTPPRARPPARSLRGSSQSQTRTRPRRRPPPHKKTPAVNYAIVEEETHNMLAKSYFYMS